MRKFSKLASILLFTSVLFVGISASAGNFWERPIRQLELNVLPSDLLREITFKADNDELRRRLQKIQVYFLPLCVEIRRSPNLFVTPYCNIDISGLFVTRLENNLRENRKKSLLLAQLDFQSKTGALLAYAQIFAIKVLQVQTLLDSEDVKFSSSVFRKLQNELEATTKALAITVGLEANPQQVVPWIKTIALMDNDPINLGNVPIDALNQLDERTLALEEILKAAVQRSVEIQWHAKMLESSKLSDFKRASVEKAKEKFINKAQELIIWNLLVLEALKKPVFELVSGGANIVPPSSISVESSMEYEAALTARVVLHLLTHDGPFKALESLGTF